MFAFHLKRNMGSKLCRIGFISKAAVCISPPFSSSSSYSSSLSSSPYPLSSSSSALLSFPLSLFYSLSHELSHFSDSAYSHSSSCLFFFVSLLNCFWSYLNPFCSFGWTALTVSSQTLSVTSSNTHWNCHIWNLSEAYRFKLLNRCTMNGSPESISISFVPKLKLQLNSADWMPLASLTFKSSKSYLFELDW